MTEPRCPFSRLSATVLALALIACSQPSSAHQAKPQDQESQDIARIAKEWERRGMMSQKEYVRLRRIISDIRQSGSIPDKDLDWSLALLQGSSEPLVHSRVMTGLSILKQTSASQKAKMTKAITPFLKSEEPLGRKSAERLQKTLRSLPEQRKQGRPNQVLHRTRMQPIPSANKGLPALRPSSSRR